MDAKKHKAEIEYYQRLAHHALAGTFGHNKIAARAASGFGTYRFIGGVGFNGEKNFGEIGPIKNYFVDYEGLRARSWQLYLESDIAQTVLGKYTTWVIGKGLKLQSEPVKRILQKAGIGNSKTFFEEFTKDVESRFAVYAKSKMSDYSNVSNLNILASEEFKSSIVGGDVLVVLRYIDRAVKVQLIDGANVITPMNKLTYMDQPDPVTGNRIIHGVEISATGEHVAYHVRKEGTSFDTERILARGPESGMLMAFMVYGTKYRIGGVRGMPILAVMFETAKKLERYKEATIGSAEERQKVAFSIEHNEISTGENPFMERTAKMFDLDGAAGAVPNDDYGNEIADKVMATTNKQTVNMPPGSKLMFHESKAEAQFKDFYTINIELFCSAVEIPPEVALSKYNSNYSASRASLKDWENTLNVRRSSVAFQFYQPIYDMFLETEILSGNISAPGYLVAKMRRDYYVLEAYRTARFSGTPVPHIDPLKEVQAERLKLGVTGAAIPLTTAEAASEVLNSGEYDANLEQYANELDKANSLGVEIPMPEPANPDQGGV